MSDDKVSDKLVTQEAAGKGKRISIEPAQMIEPAQTETDKDILELKNIYEDIHRKFSRGRWESGGCQ